MSKGSQSFKALPSWDYLNARIRYNPSDGSLTWRKRPRCHFALDGYWIRWNSYMAGREAGTLSEFGGMKYRRLKIGERLLFSHRVAFYLHHGVEPEYIDHIDGDGLNNRIENLRSASLEQNAKNSAVSKLSLSGVPGVTMQPNSRWRVVIHSRGERRSIGCYEDFFDACCARKSAEGTFGYHRNHGRVK